MPEQAPVFGGSMAESYEKYFVPILFAPYARDLAARLSGQPDAKILELACGTGAVTRELLSRLAPTASIHATDLSPAMLAFAQENSPFDPRLRWQQADALTLPFDDGQFDAVVCQFGAMFFPDKLQAFREAKRVLRSGGKLIFNVWTEMPENPVFHSVELALRSLLPDEPTPIMATPCNMADPAPVIAQLAEAGFDSAEAHRVDFPIRGFAALDVFQGFAFGTPISSFLRESGVSIEEAQQAVLPFVVERLGDPLDTSMSAWVFEAA